MAAKVGAKPEEFSENVPGTHFLTKSEAKKVLAKGKGLDSIYGSLEISNKFNLDNGVYKESQDPSAYVVAGLV